MMFFCTMPSCKIRDAYYIFLGLSLCLHHYNRAMTFANECNDGIRITGQDVWEMLVYQDKKNPIVYFRREL